MRSKQRRLCMFQVANLRITEFPPVYHQFGGNMAEIRFTGTYLAIEMNA